MKATGGAGWESGLWINHHFSPADFFGNWARTEPLENKKIGDPNFGPPVKLFLRPSLAPRRSFHTASRFVRCHGWVTSHGLYQSALKISDLFLQSSKKKVAIAWPGKASPFAGMAWNARSNV